MCAPLLLLALFMGLSGQSARAETASLLPPPLIELAPGGSRLVPPESLCLSPSPDGLRLALRGPLPEGLEARVDGKRLHLRAGEKVPATLVTVGLVVETRSERLLLDLPVRIRQDRLDALFRFRPAAGAPPPRRVAVAGSFNGWSADATLLDGPDGSGAFALRLPLPRGRHPYKIVVDGDWRLDDANPLRLSDGYGGENSLKIVSESAGESRPLLLPLDRTLPEHVRRLRWAYVDEGRPSRLDARRTVVLVNGRRLDGAFVSLVPPPENAAESWRQTLEVNVPFRGAARELTLVALNALDEMVGPVAVPLDRRPEEDADWIDRVLYFVMTDRFARLPGVEAPPRDPRVPPIAGHHGGSLEGLRRKIEEGYFRRLGVDALWISPLNRNPAGACRESVGARRHFSGYHGYWPVGLHAVDPRQGSLSDLRDTVAAAHDGGMTVLLDLVCNHVHERCPLVGQHPEWFAPLHLPDGRANVQLFDEHPYTTWFDTFLPSFAYDKAPDAVEAMTDVAAWWLKASGADGFRLDAVKHVPPLFWKALRRKLRREIDGPRGRPSFLVGETISDRKTIDAFLGPELLDGQFQFPLYWSIRDGLAKETKGLDALEAELAASDAAYPADAVMSPLLGNHDFSRFLAYADGKIPEGADEKELGYAHPPRCAGGEAAARLRRAFTFLLSIRGLPLIYYGDEVGLTGAGDPDNRRPMIFEDLAPWQEELRAHVSRLTRLRKKHRALRRGARLPLAAGPDHIVFARLHPGSAVVVALNRSDGPRELDLPIPPGMGDLAWSDELGEGTLEVRTGRWHLVLPPGDGALFAPVHR